jgi:hypothetical protein
MEPSTVNLPQMCQECHRSYLTVVLSALQLASCPGCLLIAGKLCTKRRMFQHHRVQDGDYIGCVSAITKDGQFYHPHAGMETYCAEECWLVGLLDPKPSKRNV